MIRPTLLALALLPIIAHAEPITPADMLEAHDWVAQHMHVADLPMPTVSQNPEIFAAITRQGDHHGAAKTIAAYTPGLLAAELAFDPQSDKPYLVHEMVHHAQLFNHVKYPCRAAKEREAYTLQNQYAAEKGYSVHVPEWFIDAESKCSNNE